MLKIKTWYDGEDGNAGGGEAAAAAAAAATAKGGAPTLADDFDFTSVLPDDLKADKGLEKFNTHKGKAWVEQIARSNIAAQKLVGVDPNEIMRVPADPSKMTAADRRAALERFGLPKDEKAYALKALAKPIEGFSPESPLAKWFTSTAREQGIFPDQAQAMFESFAGQLSASQAANATKIAAEEKTNVDSLQKEFGKAFEGEQKAATAGMAKIVELAGVDGKEFHEKVRAAGLGTDPVFFKALAKIARLTAEGSTGGDKGDAFSSGISPGEAHRQGTELLRQAIGVMDSNPSEAKRLNAEAQKLFAQA